MGPILGPDRPKREQDEPKRAIRSFKEPKTFIYKNLKKTFGFLKVFGYRGLSRKPQEAQDGSQKAPKKSKTPKNRNPKLRPKIIKKIGTYFGAHSENLSTAKINQKQRNFWDTLPPHLRDPNNAPPKNKREG